MRLPSPSTLRTAFVLGGALCSAVNAQEPYFGRDAAAERHVPAAASPALPEAYFGRPTPENQPLIRPLPATDVPGAPSQSTATRPEQNVERHYSIVGAVSRPGTYAGEQRSILLQTLVQQAGGLTDQAAGSVRILFAGQQEVISDLYAAGTRVVPPESVVVIDTLTSGPHRARGDSQPYVDVACLQLCDRPAVVYLDPITASVPQLLAMLGQPPEAMGAVRILAPSQNGAASGQLSSGAVVLFNPAGLDQQRLADVLSRQPLQDLVRVEAPEHQQVSAETIDMLQFLEERMKPVEPVSTADGLVVMANESIGATTAPEEALTAPAPELPSQTPAFTSIPPALAATSAGLESPTQPKPERVQPASAVQLQSVSSPRGLPASEPLTAELDLPEVTLDSEDPSAVIQAADEELPFVAADARPQWLQFGSSIAAWLLCGLAGWGVFSIWMRQHERRRVVQQIATEAATPKPTIQLPARASLSQLIENSLPLREEETPTPSQAFHGRTVGFRYLIRSGPHGLQGPHFAAARARQASPAVAVTAATVQEPAPRATMRSSTDGRQTTTRIDAPAPRETMPAASVAAERNADRAVSPMERALRSLMREGRHTT